MVFMKMLVLARGGIVESVFFGGVDRRELIIEYLGMNVSGTIPTKVGVQRLAWQVKLGVFAVPSGLFFNRDRAIGWRAYPTFFL